MADTETVTLSLEADDGTSDELVVPVQLVEMLAEGDETAPEVVGDIAMFGLAQRVHSAVHHSQGEPPEELQDVEGVTLDLFEERFGASFSELTGHDH
jgi:hypothetical protein